MRIPDQSSRRVDPALWIGSVDIRSVGDCFHLVCRMDKSDLTQARMKPCRGVVPYNRRSVWVGDRRGGRRGFKDTLFEISENYSYALLCWRVDDPVVVYVGVRHTLCGTYVRVSRVAKLQSWPETFLASSGCKICDLNQRWVAWYLPLSALVLISF